MKNSKRGTFILICILIAFIVFLLPGVTRPDMSLCGAQWASAQDNPCLDREVTISAQQIQILQLQGTINAQEIINLNLNGTMNSPRRLPPNQVVITVPVLITTTLNPNVTVPVRIVTATPSTLSPTETRSASLTPFPTTTLLPTASNAQVEIVRILSPGDINAEGIDIRNNGAVVDLTGWKLRDTHGNVYTFPQQRLFTGSVLTIYTRIGIDTPTSKFWGRNDALWSSGSAIVLIDQHGQTQSVYHIP